MQASVSCQNQTTDWPSNANEDIEFITPYFEAGIQSNVTAVVGKSAFLRCKVRNLGNKTVNIT